MNSYEEKMLMLLAEKYRKSKKDAGTNAIDRRTQIKPTELYKDYLQNSGDFQKIEAVNAVAEMCQKNGFLTVELNGGFSNEIKAIYLVDDKIDQIEQYLCDTYHYESKYAKKQYVTQVLAKYSGRTPVADQECKAIQGILQKNRIPKNYLQLEDILKALVFIEENKKQIYLREASMLIYGPSKYLEENTLNSVCRLLRIYLNRPCKENELPDEILEAYNIFKEKQQLRVKGDITIYAAGKTLDIGAFSGGVAFSADELSQLQHIVVHDAQFITVENLTSYLRLQKKDTAFFYLGGFTNRFQRDFLKKVYQDNSNIQYLHFGDIDAGGFYIHEHLCRATGIPFSEYQMFVAQLKDMRFQHCLQPLTETDRKRLALLAKQNAYDETINYMLEHNVKLEQEIISFYIK